MPRDARPCSELSSEGSGLSPKDTPAHEPASAKQEHLTPQERIAQDRSDKCVKPSRASDFDLRLVTRVVELVGFRVQPSLTQALSELFGEKPCEVDRALRLLFRCLRFLRLCGYPDEDIEVIVAQASAYMRDIAPSLQKEGQANMGLTETVHIMGVLIYLAHVYCEDQTCSVRVWHQTLFQRYCTLRTLNAAILMLLERLHFQLRVEQRELESRLTFIRQGGKAPISSLGCAA